MKYCSNCGYEVGEDADVCSNCGYVIHNKPSVSFTPTPVGQLKTMNRSLSSRQTKKQNVFSRISEMRSWFFYATSNKLR